MYRISGLCMYFGRERVKTAMIRTLTLFKAPSIPQEINVSFGRKISKVR